MGSYILDTRAAADFRYEAAKEKLINLDLIDPPEIVFRTAGDDGYSGGEHSSIGREGKLLRLAGWLDLGSYFTVSPSRPSTALVLLNKNLGRLCRGSPEPYISKKKH